MNGLVLELQADVLRDTTPVSSLLRKALLICRKLRQTESLAWIESELNGYTGAPFPEYRMIRGEIRVTTRRGPIPYVFTKSPEVAEILSRRPVDLSVPELEALLASSDDWFEYPYPPEIEADFLQRTGVRPVLHIPRSALLGILARVRTGLLDWTAQLETSGVIGNGLSFSAEEVQAASAPTLHIENYIGSVLNSSVQQNIGTSRSTLSSDDRQALRQSLEAIQGILSTLTLSREVLA